MARPRQRTVPRRCTTWSSLNLWWSPDPVATNAFNGGTWEKWHAEVDNGSYLADPLFRDWQKGDWRLKPESPAFTIGFKEWDYTLAGVRKEDAAWRARVAAIRPALTRWRQSRP
ncbi:MAG: hypothetical protein ACOX7Q_08715 [Kiritimatiellia bacterium]